MPRIILLGDPAREHVWMDYEGGQLLIGDAILRGQRLRGNAVLSERVLLALSPEYMRKLRRYITANLPPL